MPPGVYDLRICQGESLRLGLQLRDVIGAPLALAGVWDPDVELLVDDNVFLTSTGTDPKIGLASEPAGITGLVVLRIDSGVTAGLFKPAPLEAVLRWRLRLVGHTDSGEVRIVLAGKVSVS